MPLVQRIYQPHGQIQSLIQQCVRFITRVLEVLTPRHSLLDKIALGGGRYAASRCHSRARYSSAIWYQPAR